MVLGKDIKKYKNGEDRQIEKLLITPLFTLPLYSSKDASKALEDALKYYRDL